MTHSFANAARSVLIMASTVALFAVSQTVVAMSFTLSRTSPFLGLGPYSPSDIFTSPPGPAGGPPAFLASSISLGPMDNIDAMAWGPQGGLHEIFFSVDPGAAGAPGTPV